jgi:hypothetical protein
VTGKVNRGAAALGVLLLLATAALVGCGSGATTTTTGSVTTEPPGATTTGATVSDREAAPDFSGLTLDGLDVSLGEYRGKPLVLAFSASW